LNRWSANHPVLNDLIKMAYQQNLDLQVAGLRVLEARAQLGLATGTVLTMLVVPVLYCIFFKVPSPEKNS